MPDVADGSSTSSLAATLLAVLDAGAAAEPPSRAGLDLAGAYAVASRIGELRSARGERPSGRKIGFSNVASWPAYAISAPIWGMMYDTTIHPLAAELSPAGMREPKIEPEILLRLERAPDPDMDEADIMQCVSHVGQAFEIVQSPYPDWRFEAADAVAAAGLHAALVHGALAPVGAAERKDWTTRLGDFRVTLSRDGEAVDEGVASNVMERGPLAALSRLIRVLAEQGGPPLRAGELVSTGSLTRAFAIAPGESWTAEVDGLPLPPLRVHFTAGRART
jgi:2-oxo-3-hexenedioate decarboxylase